MAAYSWCLAAFFSLCFVAAAVEASGKVKVGVYYESLCPDSRRFFINQLWPVYKQLSSSIQLELFPFGNAFVTGQSGNYSYTCQHGPEECYGNIIQTCAILFLTNTKESIKFIICAFNSATQAQSIDGCLQSKSKRKQIQKCADGRLGMNLEYQMFQKTKALDPPQTFIPWITFNEAGSKSINNRANRDFLGSVCDYIVGDKPDACTNPKGSSLVKRTRYRPYYW